MLLPKDLMMKRMLLLKFVEQQVEMKLIFLLVIYLECMLNMLKNNWKIEVLDSNESEQGGFSLISFLVSGKRVYSRLKYESGAHRVQRVPKTESQGRIHTSTATVLVMPEADDIDIKIEEKISKLIHIELLEQVDNMLIKPIQRLE